MDSITLLGHGLAYYSSKLGSCKDMLQEINQNQLMLTLWLTNGNQETHLWFLGLSTQCNKKFLVDICSLLLPTKFNIGNDAHICELLNKVHAARQGEMIIAQRFTKLSGLWQESDFY